MIENKADDFELEHSRLAAVLGTLTWFFLCGLGLWYCATRLSWLQYAACYTVGQLLYWFARGFPPRLRRRREVDS